MLKKACILLLIPVLFAAAAIADEPAELLTGRMELNDNIATITTEDQVITLCVISPELIDTFTVSQASDMEYRFSGFATENGYLIHMISDTDGREQLQSDSDFPLMLTTNPALSYSIDPRRCISCRFCISACPVNAISMRRGVAIIDQEQCISCGICLEGNQTDYEGCPVDAVRREESE